MNFHGRSTCPAGAKLSRDAGQATLTPTQFNLTMVITFILTVIIVTVGFRYFLKWRKRVMTEKPSLEDLAKRAEAIDANYRKLHPDMDEPPEA